MSFTKRGGDISTYRWNAVGIEIGHAIGVEGIKEPLAFELRIGPITIIDMQTINR
jgi:hypothetical protein